MAVVSILARDIEAIFFFFFIATINLIVVEEIDRGITNNYHHDIRSPVHGIKNIY